jgi:ribosomal-protein-alanine N-acetyltransferase
VGDAGDLLTDRLLLRRPSPEDVDAILAVHRHPAAIAHNPSDALADRVEAQALLCRWLDQWRRCGFGYWTVRWREQLPVLGFCGLKSMQLRGQPVINLFYRVDPNAWGRGIATEAALRVVEWARINRSSRPVIARIRPENLASARVALKVGLRRSEYLDEHGEDGLDLIYRSAWPN